MRTCFLLLLVLTTALAGPVSAQQDVMDLVLVANECVPHHSIQTTSPFQSVTAYLVIWNPSAGGVSGWEAMIEVSGSPVAPAWTLTAGLDVDSDPNRFQVGIGLSPLALMPNGCGAVVLADWTGFVATTTNEISFWLRGVPGSVSFDGTPGYSGPYAAGDLRSLENRFVDFDRPVFCINTDNCPEVASLAAWVNVAGVHAGAAPWSDLSNKAALAATASEAIDSNDQIADDSDIVFIAPAVTQELDVDARPAFDPYTESGQWTFIARTETMAGFDNTVDLTFTHSASIAQDMILHLLDRETSTWQDLHVNPYYRYTAPTGGGIQQRVFDLFLGNDGSLMPQFSVVIDVGSAGLADLGNVASTLAGATNGYDPALDTPEPPAAPAPSLSLYFPHEPWGSVFGTRFMRDVRTPYEPSLSMGTWTFTVDRAGDFGPSVPVVLEFSPSFSSMLPWLVRLRVHETGEIIDLNANGWRYEWIPGPGGSTSFDLMIGTPEMPYLNPVSRSIPNGWSLLGAPLVQPHGAGTYQSMMLDDTSGQAFIFGYDPALGYDLLNPNDSWPRGEGVWLGSATTFDWNITGEVDPDPVDVTLNNGWTLVGYPLWFPSDLMGVSVVYGGSTITWADAVSANLVGADIHGYDNATGAYTTGTALDTWHGYWFWANQPGVVLVFDYEAMPMTALRRWQPFAVLDDEDNWRLDVAVEGAHSTLTLGTCELSSDGFDAYQDRAPAPKSPVDVDGPELFFDHPEWNLSTGAKVASDIREPLAGLPRAWDAVLTSPAPGPVTLAWDPATWGGTSDLQVYLPDQNRVVVLSMRATTSVTLDVGTEPLAVQFRTPSLTGVEDETPAAVASLTARPNPFNPQTELFFTSPKAGTATIRIHDVLGRLVTTLQAGDLPAGAQGRVTWRGRDDAGREVASGTYFAALAVDGRGVGEIRKLSLVR